MDIDITNKNVEENASALTGNAVALLTQPFKRRILPEDSFFEEGDLLRALSSKLSVLHYVDSDDEKNESFVCGIVGCTARFTSSSRFEEHYNSSHRHTCETCSRVFLTPRLLDMHISELHDSYFKMQSERQAMYQCLVNGCNKNFWDNNGRRAHMISVHHYPRTFDFHRPPGKKPVLKTHTGSARVKAQNVGQSNPIVSNLPTNKPKERCRFFYSKMGCKQGEKCSFAHIAKLEVSDEQKNEKATKDHRGDVDELSAAFRSMRIPKEISFGRRSGKGRSKLCK